MSNQKLLPLGATARLFHIPPKWLRIEAESGQIPHLKAGDILLFNLAIVEKMLIERASKGGGNEK